MGITREDVARVAHLARLHMEPAELDAMHSHFEKILEHFGALQAIDTENVAPTYHPLPAVNVLRDDAVRPSPAHDLMLKNAPRADEECFLVPLIMEDE